MAVLLPIVEIPNCRINRGGIVSRGSCLGMLSVNLGDRSPVVCGPSTLPFYARHRGHHNAMVEVGTPQNSVCPKKCGVLV